MSTSAIVPPSGLAVSLVIPVRNETESLEELIASIRRQAFPPAEIVIVDGGSTDGTPELARKLIAGDPRFRVVEAGNATPGRGRNVGIEHARHDWVALTDGGIRLESDWLQSLVAAAERNPGVSIVYGAFDPIEDTFFERCATLAYVPPRQAHADGGTRGKFIASSLMRRDAWQAVGGFPDLRAAEDLIFMDRLAADGFRDVWAPEARVGWRPQPTLARTCRRFVIFSRCNALVGRQRLWHYGVARQYVGLALFVALAAVFSWWWLIVPAVAGVLRVARSIWKRRGSHGLLWCLNPLQFALVAVIIFAADISTFVGWGQAIRGSASTGPA